MGCDIHEYIEFQRDGRWHYAAPTKTAADDHYWFSRNYVLFSLLTNAEIRLNDAEFRGYAPYPRGLPDDVSQPVFQRNVLKIVADQTAYDQLERLSDNDESCSRPVLSEAIERYRKYGSQQVDYIDGCVHVTSDGQWLTHPDWHSHSWLDLSECRRVQAAYAARPDRYSGQFYSAVGFIPEDPPVWWPDLSACRRDGRLLIHPGADVLSVLEQRNKRLENPLEESLIRSFHMQELHDWISRELSVGRSVELALVDKPPTPIGPEGSLQRRLDRMSELEAGGYPTRLVFWFDN
jgi:hypothetical protein